MRRFELLAVALALVVAACQPPAQDVGALSDPDIAAIKANLDGVVAAELAGDWDKLGDFLTEDFVGMGADMPAVEGKAAWIEFLKGMGIEVSKLSVDYLEIDGRGDLAYVRGMYMETVSFGGSEPAEMVGKFVWIFEKQADGSWLASMGIGNSDAPETEPPPPEGT
jgi:ketosteroid isomerase-like protein